MLELTPRIQNTQLTVLITKNYQTNKKLANESQGTRPAVDTHLHYSRIFTQFKWRVVYRRYYF